MDTADIKRLLEINDFKVFSKELSALFPGKKTISLADMSSEVRKRFLELYSEHENKNPGCYIRGLANKKYKG